MDLDELLFGKISKYKKKRNKKNEKLKNQNQC